MGFYKFILRKTGQEKESNTGLKKEQSHGLKQYKREKKAWFFTLVVSLFPFALIFAFYTGPSNCFVFLEFFNDISLIYVCVAMSAVAIFTSEKLNSIGYAHIPVIVIGIIVYYNFKVGNNMPIFEKYVDIREFTACFLLFSVLLGFSNLLYLYFKIKKEEGL